MFDLTSHEGCTIRMAPDKLCGDKISGWPFSLCAYHRSSLGAALTRDKAKAMKEAARQDAIQATHDRIHRLSMRAQSVVYYIEFPDYIKIGTTTCLERRVREFRLTPDKVLATEPGNYGMETARHKQFKDLRMGKLENFRPDPRLLKHIDAVRARCGEPVMTIDKRDRKYREEQARLRDEADLAKGPHSST